MRSIGEPRNDAYTIYINLSFLSSFLSFRALESSVFGKLQANYLALRTMSNINIRTQVLFILVFGLYIALIYVLNSFFFAIDIIPNHLVFTSRLARFQRHFGDGLKLRRYLCGLEIGVLAEVVSETVICLSLEAVKLAVEALLCRLSLFFC